MKVYKIIFSPTGGTEKAADIIAEESGGDIVAIDPVSYTHLDVYKRQIYSCAIGAFCRLLVKAACKHGRRSQTAREARRRGLIAIYPT